MTDVFEHKGRYYHISEASRIHKEEDVMNYLEEVL